MLMVIHITPKKVMKTIGEIVVIVDGMGVMVYALKQKQMMVIV
jgi:hypothetical protein